MQFAGSINILEIIVFVWVMVVDVALRNLELLGLVLYYLYVFLDPEIFVSVGI